MSDLFNQDLDDRPSDIENVEIQDSIKTSYLDYSMSVIIGRALPDARDGLKPVHRRILYAMNELNLSPRTPYKKSARIVGDVIGKYHPHGDTAVYDALVRLAQPFSMRELIVDGQGNFGSIDGDNAAAMRYTEARMTKLSEEILRDIDKDTVDFVPNYDETTKEPDVLPTRVPGLLLNGSEGIAVGMATKIPPHNLNELLDGLIHLVDNPKAQLSDVLEFIKGPDFPTKATIFGKQGILDAYKTGRGKIKLRAKHHIEQIKNKEIIVIDELPYQVNKAREIAKIAELARDKAVQGISEIRDESDREGIRIVIELKKDAMAEIVMNNLYKHTELQKTFGIILLAVYNKEPKIFTLLELLNLFINHRKTVIIRRTIFDLEKARARAHILEGYKIAIDNIDEIVALIKQSANKEEAKEQLMSRFSLSQIQANAILEMRLHRLTGLARDEIEAEYKALMELIKELDSILKSESKLLEIIKEELLEIRAKFDSPRLTQIQEDYDAIDVEDLIPNEPMVVTITHNGYVKRVNIKSYEMQKRGGKGKTAVTTHDDDFIESFFVSNTHDTLLFVTNMGQLYWLKVYRIPEAGRTAKGRAVLNLINLRADEKIMAIIPTSDFAQDKSLALFTRNGIVKRTNLSEFSNIRSNGVRAIVLDEDDELVTARIATNETKYLFILTQKAQCIKFDISKTREQGRSTRGVRGIKFKHDNDIVVDANVISSDEQEILTVSENGIGKRTTADEYRLTNRGGSGVIAMKLSNKTGSKLIGSVMYEADMDLMALTNSGKMIRVDMGSISKSSRNTSGVYVIKGDSVASIAKCPKEESEPEELDDKSEEE
jgi:DNA gyrase subunit A